MTKSEKILFAIIAIICILIVITLVTGKIEVIIVINKHIESKVKNMDLNKVLQIAKYITR